MCGLDGSAAPGQGSDGGGGAGTWSGKQRAACSRWQRARPRYAGRQQASRSPPAPKARPPDRRAALAEQAGGARRPPQALAGRARQVNQRRTVVGVCVQARVVAGRHIGGRQQRLAGGVHVAVQEQGAVGTVAIVGLGRKQDLLRGGRSRRSTARQGWQGGARAGARSRVLPPQATSQQRQPAWQPADGLPVFADCCASCRQGGRRRARTSPRRTPLVITTKKEPFWTSGSGVRRGGCGQAVATEARQPRCRIVSSGGNACIS